MQMTAYAPGRVELLGNHTDYNEGVVLSAAIDRGITITGEASGGSLISLQSADREVTIDLANGLPEPLATNTWANYLLGVVRGLLEAGYPVAGFSAKISSTLPTGAGLSSSAALEVATCLFSEKLFGFSLSPLDRAKLCKRAENVFVGVNCGLLDQVSSVFGAENAAIFLDCRAETVANVGFPDGFELLITDSSVKHELTGGEYNERRAQCFEAAKVLGVKALRDTTSEAVLAAPLDDVVRRRALHVTGEIERVFRGVELLRTGNGAGFGELMWASHESSRVNFENSTEELDALVEIAHQIPGVYGSRLTGGGFGGATVSLIDAGKADAISSEIQKRYVEKVGIECKTYLSRLSQGAR
ncbi:MAG TPA: galactokinase [Chthoniobacterales bacterium]